MWTRLDGRGPAPEPPADTMSTVLDQVRRGGVSGRGNVRGGKGAVGGGRGYLETHHTGAKLPPYWSSLRQFQKTPGHEYTIAFLSDDVAVMFISSGSLL